MPLMHSENIDDQLMSVSLFAYDVRALEFAIAHKNIIEKFGRFPHRNKALGRASTVEEIEFLMQPGSGF